MEWRREGRAYGGQDEDKRGVCTLMHACKHLHTLACRVADNSVHAQQNCQIACGLMNIYEAYVRRPDRCALLHDFKHRPPHKRLVCLHALLHAGEGAPGAAHAGAGQATAAAANGSAAALRQKEASGVTGAGHTAASSAPVASRPPPVFK